MEAILKFNLPEDQSDFDSAINGYKWSLVAWELDEWLRNEIKYGKISHKTYIELQQCRDKLHEIKDEHGLKFE